MASGAQQLGKKISLGVLAVLCVALVYRNLLAPARQNAPEPPAPRVASGGQAANVDQRESAPRAAQRSQGRRDKPMNAQELAALDPTLRLDLIEKTAGVKYEGGPRNIFQFYTPPPKPVAPAIVAPPAPGSTQPPPPPPPPSIALKFYGTATPQGTSDKKAFLTNGEEIFIGKEGEVVDKHYKIVRIGVNSLEWEDTQNHQKGQLPLMVE